MDRGDKDREDRSRSDQVPYRPDSRNSYGASRSTSTTSLQPTIHDRTAHHPREAHEVGPEYGRRSTAASISAEAPVSVRYTDRSDLSYRRSDGDRYQSRPSSPPPPLSVPAFGGSLMPQVSASNQETPTKVVPKEEEPLIHPSRRALMEPSREPTQIPTDILNAPTAPKAQQRRSGDDNARSGSAANPASIPPREAPLGSNWSKRFVHPNVAPPSTASPSAASRLLNAEQPSIRKALDEEGRNGNIPLTSNFKPPVSDTSNQTSPMKIPTGPRAGRTAPPSIRQPIQPSIRGPNTRPPPMIPRAQRQASTWSWVRPGHGPSIMNKVPTKKELEINEEKSRPSPTHSAYSAVEKWRQKNILPAADSQKLVDKRADNEVSDETEEAENKDESSPPPTHKNMVRDKAGDDELSDGNGSELELGMDLDDADFHNAQQNYNREMRRLQAKRPRAPWDNPDLLQMLTELDALAVAMREREEGGIGANASLVPVGGLPSPKIEGDEIEVKSEEGSIQKGNEIDLNTPPIESLPFLHQGPPTPFSDYQELMPDVDHDGTIKELICAKLEEDHRNAARTADFIKRTFVDQFKSWRRGLDIREGQARVKDEETRTGLTPPETTPEVISAPQTVRSRRVVSEYGLDAVMKESLETAAREERTRREREEREAQVYIPVDTFNSEREAEIPNMLGPTEIENLMFADNNEFIESDRVLDALKYVPPKDDFTKEEHKEFLYHYVVCPKRFGEIAEKLGRRDYKACVRHYYASKRSANYRNQEAKFYKTGRGKRFLTAAERAAAIRPRGGLLASSMDGAIDYEAQNAALTESGRPKRAAAPTFGESAEPEIVPTSTVTPARRTAIAKDGSLGMQSAEKSKPGKVKPASTGLKPGRRPKILKDQPQPILAAAPDTSQGLSPIKEATTQSIRAFNPPAISEAPQRADEHEAAQLLAQFPTNMPSYPVPSYTEHWVTGQSTFTAPIQLQDPILSLKHEHTPLPPTPIPQQGSEPTSSYWSVPEKQDFRSYVAYFGTNWQAISTSLKTKTQQMVCPRPPLFMLLILTHCVDQESLPTGNRS